MWEDSTPAAKTTRNFHDHEVRVGLDLRNRSGIARWMRRADCSRNNGLVRRREARGKCPKECRGAGSRSKNGIPREADS